MIICTRKNIQLKPIEIGKIMRDKYEKGFVRSKNDFEEALKNVLSDCER